MHFFQIKNSYSIKEFHALKHTSSKGRKVIII